MSIFQGQFGSFGGGFIMGPQGGRTGEGLSDIAGVGGGFMHGAGGTVGFPRPDASGVGGGFFQGQGPMIQEVPVAHGAVAYAVSTGVSKARQPGRMVPKYVRGPFAFPVGPEGPGSPFDMPVAPQPPPYGGGVMHEKRYK